jgi:hypothetical protein
LDYKPVSVPRRAAVIPLGLVFLPGSSDLPGSRTERAAPPPLFGLAPHGVYPASRIAPAAVRSYRTFSPLPAANCSCSETAGGIFSVALSVKPALSGSPRPLAGMLPCGDRTFLPSASGTHLDGRLPVQPAHLIFSKKLCHRDRDKCVYGLVNVQTLAGAPETRRQE